MENNFWKRSSYYFAIFFSSFLLFQQELIVGKMLLPRFGGGFQIWTTSLSFFLVVLCLGYLYSHYISKHFTLKYYRLLHLLFLLLGLISFSSDGIWIHSFGSEFLNVLSTLLLSIAPTFFWLSTNGTMFQAWYIRTDHSDAAHPYFLYSASNVGSFLGLLSYPFVVEPLFNLETQWIIWKSLYGLMIAFSLLSAFQVRGQKLKYQKEAVSIKWLFLWGLLGFFCNALMITTTEVVSLDLGNLPVLWIIPIIIYLATLILSFKRKPWYPMFLNRILLALIILFELGDSFGAAKYSWLFKVLEYYCLLFLGCMYFHRWLYQNRPQNKELMTLYYISISVGGALGCVVVSFFIPLFAGGHISLQAEHWGVIILMLFGALFLNAEISRRKKQVLGISFSLLLVLGSAFHIGRDEKIGKRIFSTRNFYGSYSIFDDKNSRTLFSGNTIHGQQDMSPEMSHIPLRYYHYKSPIGDVFNLLHDPQNIAVIGLGIGSLLEYAQARQHWTIYELDPEVINIAQKYFSHIEHAKVKPHFVVGDGRVSLQKENNDQFDLVIVDAFSSDYIPFHLLTKEAVAMYMGKVKSDGLVAIHISNRIVALDRLIFEIGKTLKLDHACKLRRVAINENYSSESHWCVFSKASQNQLLTKLLEDVGWEKDNVGKRADGFIWSDSYVNLFPYLKVLE